jgi:hypothetical protein
VVLLDLGLSRAALREAEAVGVLSASTRSCSSRRGELCDRPWGDTRRRLHDLLATGAGWERLGVRHPGVATWRTAAAGSYTATGHRLEAGRLAAEQLELARGIDTPRIVGSALRVCAVTAAEELLAETVGLLERTPARVDLAHAFLQQGALRRRTGRRTDARVPLRRALEIDARGQIGDVLRRQRWRSVRAPGWSTPPRSERTSGRRRSLRIPFRSKAQTRRGTVRPGGA